MMKLGNFKNKHQIEVAYRECKGKLLEYILRLERHNKKLGKENQELKEEVSELVSQNLDLAIELLDTSIAHIRLKKEVNQNE